MGDLTTVGSSMPTQQFRWADLYPTVVAFAIIQLLTALFAHQYGLAIVFLPLAAVVASVCFLWPRIGLVILTGSWFLRFDIFGVPGFYPADAIMLIVAAGYVVRQVGSGQRVIPSTPLNLPIALFMLVYSISLFNAVDLGAGLKSWLRHLQLFALFVAVVGCSDRIVIRSCLRLFLVVCLVISFFNIAAFVQLGGRERVFGPAGILFSGFLALGGTLLTSFALLDNRPGRRLFWWSALIVLLLAQMANQSRGAMMQMLSGIAFVHICAWVLDRRLGLGIVRRRIRAAIVVVSIASLGVIVAMGPELYRVVDRYSSKSGNELLTLRLREFLWGAALQIFVDHPVIGVGPAQSVRIVSYLPDLKFDPAESHVRGLSVHNSILQYLAESGILGSLCLMFILWRALSMGRMFLRRQEWSDDIRWELGLWGMVFVIVSRYLYEGHLFYSISGMTTVTLIGFLYVAVRRRNSPLQSGQR